ncbi:MAG: phosphatase PAP2 family protein [Tissierellia bacterium]|nr:phosphatase PAP2 family protein [Tissierellia bacterium]
MTLHNLILRQVLFLTLQVILYFGCEIFQKNFHDVKRPWDDKIPIVAEALLVYVLWFPLIALFPISLYQAAPALYPPYMVAWALDVLVSVAIYLIYPTSFTRPQNFQDIRNGWMLKAIYRLSYRGINCMPSLHCSLSFMVLLMALLASPMALALRWTYGLVAGGIIISTLLTKQHVLLDAMTGILLGGACLLVAFFLL